jgi:hypothetical protein
MPAKPTLAASMHTPLPFVPHAWPLTGQLGGSTALGSVVQNFTPPSADGLHISGAAQPLAAGAPAAPTAGAPPIGGAAMPPLFCATMPAAGGAIIPLLPAAAAAPAAPGVPALPVAVGTALEEPAALGMPAIPLAGAIALAPLAEPPDIPADPAAAPPVAVIGIPTFG